MRYLLNRITPKHKKNEQINYFRNKYCQIERENTEKNEAKKRNVCLVL